MKLYTIIVSLILGTSLQTYAMQKQTQDQTTQKKYALGFFIPAFAPHATQEVIQNAITSCLKKTGSYQYGYAACIISSKGPKKISALKDPAILSKKLSKGDVGIFVKLSNKSYGVALSKEDLADLDRISKQRPECITLIGSLAEFNKPGEATISFEQKIFDALPPHMQANLKSYYPWLSQALDSSTESEQAKQPVIEQPAVVPCTKDILSAALTPEQQFGDSMGSSRYVSSVISSPISTQPQSPQTTQPVIEQPIIPQTSSNSYKKWALWATIPVAAIATYIAYTYFFKKAPAITK